MNMQAFVNFYMFEGTFSGVAARILWSLGVTLLFSTQSMYPANTQRRRNVVTTSLQRHDVAVTL